MINKARLTPDQIEALIQFAQDPGARGLHYEDDRDTESRVELEAYVVTANLDMQRKLIEGQDVRENFTVAA